LKWRARHYQGLDPGLVGEKAFEHPAVAEYWRWLTEEYTPPSSTALVTPCSNVKPYTRSPASRKTRGLLRRLGLWDEEAGKPAGIEWLYFSDLLLLVPYSKAEDYPACCYEVPPDVVLASRELSSLVVEKLANAVERLWGGGLGGS
jgi:predicted RNA-binding protein